MVARSAKLAPSAPGPAQHRFPWNFLFPPAPSSLVLATTSVCPGSSCLEIPIAFVLLSNTMVTPTHCHCCLDLVVAGASHYITHGDLG